MHVDIKRPRHIFSETPAGMIDNFVRMTDDSNVELFVNTTTTTIIIIVYITVKYWERRKEKNIRCLCVSALNAALLWSRNRGREGSSCTHPEFDGALRANATATAKKELVTVLPARKLALVRAVLDTSQRDSYACVRRWPIEKWFRAYRTI